MTILSAKMKTEYIANGTDSIYEYDFLIPRSDEVAVFIDDVQIFTFTIYGVGDPSGGRIVFDTPPPNLSAIRIERDIEFTQLIDYIPNDSFPSVAHETALDRIVMMIQQVNNIVLDALNLAFVKASDTPANVSTVVPKPVPGFTWRWNSLGTDIEYYDIANVGVTIIPIATDDEIALGAETQPRLVSPFQVKTSVETHSPSIIVDINNVGWLSVVDVLPGTLLPNHAYYVKQ